jgi:hypothetical protein
VNNNCTTADKHLVCFEEIFLAASLFQPSQHVLRSRGAQISQKSMSHLNILGATIKYLVTMVTWHTGFVEPRCEDTYIPCNVQFIYCNLEIYLGTQCATPFQKTQQCTINNQNQKAQVQQEHAQSISSGVFIGYKDSIRLSYVTRALQTEHINE